MMHDSMLVAFRWERRLSVAYFFVGWNTLLAVGWLWYRQRQQRELTGDERTDKINRAQKPHGGNLISTGGRRHRPTDATDRPRGRERQLSVRPAD
ncbi:hypothetical protein FJT64_009459 [Amphibalanus amphitrite]|uniref:Uncharacterized protein n=1 Tax=Amphibalanus amphitrite TaxID=1232801 RepID=A0A6A4VM15_AMPAM|nr:hypothetical protein FJT64_009459 [Amphibalanus amphitrite]